MISFILQKDKETMHTFSENVKQRKLKDGWIHIITIKGFNMSFSHIGEQK